MKVVMGILDDLRDEANQTQEEDKEDLLRKEQLKHNYQMLILPKMQQLYSYFKELIDYLSVIKKPVIVTDYSKRYKDLGTMSQGLYKLSTDKYGGISNLDKLTDITLRFYCISTDHNEIQLTFDNKIEFDQEKKFLSLHKVPFSHTKNISGNIVSDKNKSLEIMVTCKIPVIFKFSVNYNQSKITLNIYNHENFENRTQHFNPEQIDDVFMDKLARYILRKDDDFIRIDIDESYKEKIRQQIELQKKRQKEELNQAELGEKNNNEKKLLNQLRSFLIKK